MVQCGPLDKRAQSMTFDDKLMGTLIQFVSSHEVGHTLGLRHNMAASSEQVVSTRENVMQAQKAVQIAGKRYEVGKGTVLELNTSQVQLTEAELTYNQSIYDYLVAKADLDQVLGKDYIAGNEE